MVVCGVWQRKTRSPPDFLARKWPHVGSQPPLPLDEAHSLHKTYPCNLLVSHPSFRYTGTGPISRPTFVNLFDLVLALYHIPFGDALVRDLREKLREEAKGFSSKR